VALRLYWHLFNVIRMTNLFYLHVVPGTGLLLHLIILRHITLNRSPLDGRSARRRDLYLTAYNTYKRQTSLPPAGFDPAVPVSERPQAYAIDRASAGMGCL